MGVASAVEGGSSKCEARDAACNKKRPGILLDPHQGRRFLLEQVNGSRRTYRAGIGQASGSRRSSRSVALARIWRAPGFVALALLLIPASLMAVDMHRLAFHGLQPFAANARVGRYCAAHGENPAIAERANASRLRASQSELACPLCAGNMLLHDAFALAPQRTRTGDFARSSDEPAPDCSSIPFASLFRAHSRGPPPA